MAERPSRTADAASRPAAEQYGRCNECQNAMSGMELHLLLHGVGGGRAGL